MDDELWRRADALLEAALDIVPARRGALIDEVAAGDPELANLVRRLLEHAEETSEGLVPGLDLSPLIAQDFLDAVENERILGPGTVLGRYRLLGELGRGGMAVVYSAERLDGGFEQQVAIKQIYRPGGHLMRRLEQERQILARATHPDMARLLDGGVDDQGRPYLVMERVDGVPIDTYCDRERLDIEARLRLFLRIAAAVQHAHSNLVVHCDIKPSNILITAEGHPKLLDFGIARLLEQPHDSASALTLTQGPRPMTPAYASPEQVRNEPVNTLSDIYQLGLLLYRLLTGRPPYRHDPSRSPLDLARRISEEPPARPHKALFDTERRGDATDSAEAIAERRRTTVPRLARELRGDLGQIVLMALRKEPERRYASVGRMIDDVERYLAGRTVAARPDSLGYRVRTFTRRNRGAVALAVLLAASLLVFSGVSVVQAGRIAKERDRANREAEITAEVSGFLTDIFQVSDPGEARGNSITAREILDRGVEQIDLQMPEPTLVRARLKRTIGAVYENLGLYDVARTLFEDARTTARDVAGEDAPDAMSAEADLGRVLLRLGRYDEAETRVRAAFEARTRQLGDVHPETLASKGHLATLFHIRGEYSEAERLNRELLEVRRQSLGPDHPDTLAAANNLASAHFAQGNLDEVELLYREILEGYDRTLGPDHPRTLAAASNLGSVWIQLERYDDAEPLLRSTIDRRRQILGEEHPATLTSEDNLAGLLADRGEHAEAEALYRQLYDRRRAVHGEDHPRTYDALEKVAWIVAQDPSRLAEALPLYREALAGLERLDGPEHPLAVRVLYDLATLEARLNLTDKALANLALAVERGYRDRAILDDPALVALREHPNMQAILETVRQEASED